MTAMLIDQLIDQLTKQFGDRQFFTIDELHSVGFFGTKHAARASLRKGKLAFVKISPRRRVIPRQVLLDYLRTNLSTQEEQ